MATTWYSLEYGIPARATSMKLLKIGKHSELYTVTHAAQSPQRKVMEYQHLFQIGSDQTWQIGTSFQAAR